MSFPQRAGKTAPALAEDIRIYDTAHPSPIGRNLLSEVPPVYPDRFEGRLNISSGEGCRHTYVTKTDQTCLAKDETQRRPGMSAKLSAMCSKCRCHLQIVVNYTGSSAWETKKSNHIHHLIYKSGRQAGNSSTDMTETGQMAETFHYQCSDWSCSATVSLRILSPLLSPEMVCLLTNPELVRKRADDAFAFQPKRLEGMAHPLPITALDNLRLYLLNALHNRERSKSIPTNNKRFMLSFGVDGAPCKELLEFLGFTYMENERCWQPPQTAPNPAKPYQSTVCILIDDAIHELVALINSRPAVEKREINPTPLPPSSTDDIYEILEASDYPKSPDAHSFQMPDGPCYEDLGTLEDMSAYMIVDSYHRQCLVDPSHGPLYLGCLKTIGMLRGGADGEIIDQTVQVAYSEGKYTRDDIRDAYKYFGLAYDDPGLTEDIIIGKFYAFLSSSSQDADARTHLWRIGQSRGSERIRAASEDRVTSAEQALVFLGVDEQTSDDFVITMYTAKVNDNPSLKDLADKAVQLIAETRNSGVLNHFLKTGETIANEMDIGDAYRLLQIPDRTADEGAIIAAYTICIDDNPEQAELYVRALGLIAKEMDSATLKTMAGISAAPEVNVSDWPVGLQNIGNTCYLNSLLQFYFSILPYRDLVLNIDRYQMDLTQESSLAVKQVGSRRVTEKEIERSLRFLRELGVLFRDMIFSPGPSVTPGQELARLTLISSSNEAAIRRRSTATAAQSLGLGHIDGVPVFGPLGPPQPTTDNQAMLSGKEAQGAPKATDMNDADSGSTLFYDSNGPDQQLSFSGSDHEGYKTITPTTTLEPPIRPPPVPPRPAPDTNQERDQRKQLIEEVEIGAQQDVTEVISNVLFQSQCAIKPRSVASDGEQVDQIKDLFYGQTRSYISTGVGIRSKEERWCDIKVDVASGPRDIYAAIDGAFDAQKISVDNSEAEQYGAITKLPPILQIQVQRVQFDPVKKTSFKSTNHLQLHDIIYMDRYMDTQRPEILGLKRQCWEWKDTLRSLEARKAELLRMRANDGYNMPSLFRRTERTLNTFDVLGQGVPPQDPVDSFLDDIQEYLNDDGDSDFGIENMAIEPRLYSEFMDIADEAEAELKSENADDFFKSSDGSTKDITDEWEAVENNITDLQMRIQRQFSELKNLPYCLYAVFVHRGSVSFGHYWIYIYDFRKNIWRKYNDEYVTEVHNQAEIFDNLNDTNPPTPYFLVYINERMIDRLVDPVCREIRRRTPPESVEDVPLYPTDGMNMDLTFDWKATPPTGGVVAKDSSNLKMEDDTGLLRSDEQY